MKCPIHLLLQLAGVIVFLQEVGASVELSSLGSPKCDPPGRWRTGRKLNFTESRGKGAVVANNGFSWLTKLEDCANWCCRLPAVNCSVAMLEIKSKGANCHLVVCYPTELCVFNYAPDYLTYDRSLFVPPVTETTSSSNAEPSFSFQDDTKQHKSVIKPRKGVEDLPPEPSSSSTPTSKIIEPAKDSPIAGLDEDEDEVPPAKPKTSVGTIFLYSSLILALMGLGAFFGQKFLDCWERRHYTRADYLLDGMYEHKPTSCS